MVILILFLVIFIVIILTKTKERFSTKCKTTTAVSKCNKTNNRQVKSIVVHTTNWQFDKDDKNLKNYIKYDYFDKMIIRGLNDIFKNKVSFNLINVINEDIYNNLSNNYHYHKKEHSGINTKLDYSKEKKAKSDSDILEFVENDLLLLKKILSQKNLDKKYKAGLKYYLMTCLTNYDKNDENIHILMIPLLHNNLKVIKLNDNLYVMSLYNHSLKKNIDYLPIKELPPYWIQNYFKSIKLLDDIDIKLNNVGSVSDVHDNLKENYNSVKSLIKKVKLETNSLKEEIDQIDEELKKIYDSDLNKPHDVVLLEKYADRNIININDIRKVGVEKRKSIYDAIHKEKERKKNKLQELTDLKKTTIKTLTDKKIQKKMELENKENEMLKESGKSLYELNIEMNAIEKKMIKLYNSSNDQQKDLLINQKNNINLSIKNSRLYIKRILGLIGLAKLLPFNSGLGKQFNKCSKTEIIENLRQVPISNAYKCNLIDNKVCRDSLDYEYDHIVDKYEEKIVFSKSNIKNNNDKSIDTCGNPIIKNKDNTIYSFDNKVKDISSDTNDKQHTDIDSYIYSYRNNNVNYINSFNSSYY